MDVWPSFIDSGYRLIDFFKYYSRDYTYNTGVASIKAGLVKKSTKGWLSEVKAPSSSGSDDN